MSRRLCSRAGLLLSPVKCPRRERLYTFREFPQCEQQRLSNPSWGGQLWGAIHTLRLVSGVAYIQVPHRIGASCCYSVLMSCTRAKRRSVKSSTARVTRHLDKHVGRGTHDGRQSATRRRLKVGLSGRLFVVNKSRGDGSWLFRGFGSVEYRYIAFCWDLKLNFLWNVNIFIGIKYKGTVKEYLTQTLIYSRCYVIPNVLR